MLAPRECIHPRPPHRVCGHESLITRPRASRSFIISRQRLPRGHSNDHFITLVCACRCRLGEARGDIRGCARHGRYGYANIGDSRRHHVCVQREVWLALRSTMKRMGIASGHVPPYTAEALPSKHVYSRTLLRRGRRGTRTTVQRYSSRMSWRRIYGRFVQL